MYRESAEPCGIATLVVWGVKVSLLARTWNFLLVM